MSCNWTRRALLALVSVSALLVAACGSGSIESQLRPSRIISFGDGMSDLGQVGGKRYTVNDGGVNNWALQVAASFGLGLSTQAAGGTSFAAGNARVSTDVDAAGGSAPTVKEQIDAFLASGSFGANDLILVSGGTADVIAETQKTLTVPATQTSAQALINVRQAGRDLAAQVRRLVQAGAKHVVVIGPYHLGKSPWGTATGQQTALTEASSKFNEELLIGMVDLGANVLYVDAALLFNLMVASPSAYGMSNSTDIVCTSVDNGPGIGTGTGQVNSFNCGPTTVVNTSYNSYMFADRVYPTPQAHLKLGEFAFSRIRERW